MACSFTCMQYTIQLPLYIYVYIYIYMYIYKYTVHVCLVSCVHLYDISLNPAFLITNSSKTLVLGKTWI